MYDLSTQKQKFILKKNDQRRITFLSVGTIKTSQNNSEIKTSQKAGTSINPESETDNLNEKMN